MKQTKYTLISVFALIGMLLVLSPSHLRADGEVIAPVPASALSAVEGVAEADMFIYQVMLAEFKKSDSGIGFLQSGESSLTTNVYWTAHTDTVSALVDALIKGKIVEIMTRPTVATLIDQHARVVIGSGISDWKIELLPQRQGDEIRTKITLTYKENHDGGTHTYTVDAVHVQRDGTTMLLFGKLGDKDILFTMRMVQRNASGE